MSGRTYPPQPWVHDARCEEITAAGLERLTPRAAFDKLPHAWRHTCFTKATVEFDLDVVAEPAEPFEHPYVRSSIWPADATGPLCLTCRGTHPESAIEAQRRTRPADDAAASGIGARA